MAIFVEKAHITSRKNPKILEAAAIKDKPSRRKELGLFFVEGARLTADAAASGTEIFRLFYTGAALQKYKQYLEAAVEQARESYLVEDHVATLLASTKSAQGVFCLCKMRPQPSLLEIQGKILVLENLQDPANLGNMLRAGEALGIGGFVLCGDCCDPFAPKTLRASMGAVFRANLYSVATIEEAGAILIEKGFTLYPAVPDSKAQAVTCLQFAQNAAVIIGNEGGGLSPQAKILGIPVTIPMAGRAESLNAATAAAIFMWEMVKHSGQENEGSV